MKELSARIESDGKEELSSYDKYSCWCEDTLARKAKDISSAKEQVDGLQTLVQKLQGEIGTHGVEIENLNKLIAENRESQSEAEEMRGQDNSEYENEKSESEQCIGALEAAIRALAGAGAGKKGFLETLQQARALSVVDGVREVLRKASYSAQVPEKDLDFARAFFGKSGQFMVQHGGVSAAQTGSTHNPFGDYAPQSDRIVGILKGLYDTFTQSLEKGNVEEADAQKAFEEFMATKKAELKTLEGTKEQQELSKAEKAKKMAESKLLRADTQAQLKADEEFFATTQEGCKDKAKEWGERVRMRTQELQGINKAAEILSSPEALETFSNSSSIALVQLATQRKAVGPHRALSSKVSPEHFVALQSLARKFHSTSLDRIVAQARAGGYFDKVIADIDSMIALLRKEEAMDIEHRDRCQNSENKNKNDKEDLQRDMEKANAAIETMKTEETDLQAQIKELGYEIGNSTQDKQELLAMRTAETSRFRSALETDKRAAELITKAIETMAAFYERNKLSAIQATSKRREEPEYSSDPDRAPETSWDGDKYAGRKSEHVGVTAILEMIREDVYKEMETAKRDEASAQGEYKKQSAALADAIRSQEMSKAASEKELAELQAKILAKEEFLSAKTADLDGETKLAASIYDDCSWVSGGARGAGPSFDTRAQKRKTEMDGLVAAKNYLAGVEDGTALDAGASS